MRLIFSATFTVFFEMMSWAPLVLAVENLAAARRLVGSCFHGPPMTSFGIRRAKRHGENDALVEIKSQQKTATLGLKVIQVTMQTTPKETLTPVCMNENENNIGLESSRLHSVRISDEYVT
jgi:hypothetical protein